MRRSEIHTIFEQFKELHQRLTRSALEGKDDDYAAVKSELDGLLPVISQNFDLFNAEERDFITMRVQELDLNQVNLRELKRRHLQWKTVLSVLRRVPRKWRQKTLLLRAIRARVLLHLVTLMNYNFDMMLKMKWRRFVTKWPE